MSTIFTLEELERYGQRKCRFCGDWGLEEVYVLAFGRIHICLLCLLRHRLSREERHRLLVEDPKRRDLYSWFWDRGECTP